MKMTAIEIIERIHREITMYKFGYAGSIDIINKGLISPYIISCCNSFNGDRPEDYWLVFSEAGNGYFVVLDEVNNEFGLAVKNKYDGYSFIGLYGSFPDTIESM